MEGEGRSGRGGARGFAQRVQRRFQAVFRKNDFGKRGTEKEEKGGKPSLFKESILFCLICDKFKKFVVNSVPCIGSAGRPAE